MTDLTYMDALEVSGLLAAGNCSAEELMRATLARIEAVNPALNAIVSLRDADALLAEARGADGQERRGWLHGVPIAVKDLANAEGFATSRGSTLFAGEVAAGDDIHIARLRAAGAIVIGKTNTPEFGLGSHTFNPVFGATQNPYGAGFTCGGSSGGAAVALAAGLISVADGSDMMGSLRNPAGWNNVYGMRPSWGLVPSEPAGDMFTHSLATNGPMARSPRDLAALLDVMAGPDARQPHGRAQADCLPQIAADVTQRRIGWLGDWGGAYAFEPGISALAETAMGQFEDIGCRVEALAPPFAREALWDSWTGLRSFSTASRLRPLYENPEHRGHLKDTAQWEVTRGLEMTALEVDLLGTIRSDWFAAAAALFDTYDVLALPTAQVWPFPIDIDYPRQIAGQTMDTYHRWMEVVIPASLIGLPVVAVPIGFGGPNDMPMGLQLIGRLGSDAALLQMAEAWHQATNWPKARRPDLGPV